MMLKLLMTLLSFQVFSFNLSNTETNLLKKANLYQDFIKIQKGLDLTQSANALRNWKINSKIPFEKDILFKSPLSNSQKDTLYAMTDRLMKSSPYQGENTIASAPSTHSASSKINQFENKVAEEVKKIESTVQKKIPTPKPVIKPKKELKPAPEVTSSNDEEVDPQFDEELKSFEENLPNEEEQEVSMDINDEVEPLDSSSVKPSQAVVIQDDASNKLQPETQEIESPAPKAIKVQKPNIDLKKSSFSKFDDKKANKNDKSAPSFLDDLLSNPNLKKYLTYLLIFLLLPLLIYLFWRRGNKYNSEIEHEDYDSINTESAAFTATQIETEDIIINSSSDEDSTGEFEISSSDLLPEITDPEISLAQFESQNTEESLQPPRIPTPPDINIPSPPPPIPTMAFSEHDNDGSESDFDIIDTNLDNFEEIDLDDIDPDKNS